jgi:hypothetical protein
MLEINKYIGIPESKTSGLDSLERCLNKKHYISYKKDISYRYNSKGFRDHEWPNDLSDVVWCVGDSFTVGIGQPFEETWPHLLENKSGKRCLNIGDAGCSNDTIALRTQEIWRLHNPKNIVVMWSYFHRRRTTNENVHHDPKNFGAIEDLKNFYKNYEIVNAIPTNVVNLLVPRAFIDLNQFSRKQFEYFMTRSNIFTAGQVSSILLFPQIDYARDGHHFDLNTSKLVCNLIGKHLNPPVEIAYTVDNSSKYPI